MQLCYFLPSAKFAKVKLCVTQFSVLESCQVCMPYKGHSYPSPQNIHLNRRLEVVCLPTTNILVYVTIVNHPSALDERNSLHSGSLGFLEWKWLFVWHPYRNINPLFVWHSSFLFKSNLKNKLVPTLMVEVKKVKIIKEKKVKCVLNEITNTKWAWTMELQHRTTCLTFRAIFKLAKILHKQHIL